MTANELAHLLCRAAEKGKLKEEKMAHIILFGIKYADELNEYRGKVKDVVRRSGVSRSDSTVEVHHGMNLAKYVSLNNEDIV